MYIPSVTAQGIWTLVVSPRSARLLDPDLIEAVTEEGTGPGVGEVQRFVRRYGGGHSTQRIIVTRFVPPTYAETELLDSPVCTGSRYQIEEVDGGVLFRYSSWTDVAVDGAQADGVTLAVTQDALDGFVLAVHHALVPGLEE